MSNNTQQMKLGLHPIASGRSGSYSKQVPLVGIFVALPIRPRTLNREIGKIYDYFKPEVLLEVTITTF